MLSLIGICLIVTGVGLLYLERDLLANGLRSYRWNPIQGRIVSLQNGSFEIPYHSRRGWNSYRVQEITYAYEYVVEGREYGGSRFCFGGPSDTRRLRVRPGDKVTVYYDPESPDRAVLKRGLTMGALFGLYPIVLGSIFIAAFQASQN